MNLRMILKFVFGIPVVRFKLAEEEAKYQPIVNADMKLRVP
jgi:hypothetical protein